MPKRASSLSSDLDLDLPLPGFQNGVSSRGRKRPYRPHTWPQQQRYQPTSMQARLSSSRQPREQVVPRQWRDDSLEPAPPPAQRPRLSSRSTSGPSISEDTLSEDDEDLVHTSSARNRRTVSNHTAAGKNASVPVRDETGRFIGVRPKTAAEAAQVVEKGGIFKSAAVRVLQEERRLMTTGEIARLALARGFIRVQGKTPEATMASALYTDVKRKGGEGTFVRPQEGLFGLRAWRHLPDAAEVLAGSEPEAARPSSQRQMRDSRSATQASHTTRSRHLRTPDDRVAESVPSSSGAPAAGSRPTTASEPGQGPNMLAPHSSAFHYTQPPGFAGLPSVSHASEVESAGPGPSLWRPTPMGPLPADWSRLAAVGGPTSLPCLASYPIALPLSQGNQPPHLSQVQAQAQHEGWRPGQRVGSTGLPGEGPGRSGPSKAAPAKARSKQNLLMLINAAEELHRSDSLGAAGSEQPSTAATAGIERLKDEVHSSTATHGLVPVISPSMSVGAQASAPSPPAASYVPPPGLDLTVYGYNAARLAEGLAAANLHSQGLQAASNNSNAINIMNLHLAGDFDVRHGNLDQPEIRPPSPPPSPVMLPPRPEAVNGGLHMHSASFPQVPGLPPGMPSLAMQSEAEARGESSIGDMAPLLAAKSVSMEDLVAVELRVRSLEARHGQIHPQVGKAYLLLSNVYRKVAGPDMQRLAEQALQRSLDIISACNQSQGGLSHQAFESFRYLLGKVGADGAQGLMAPNQAGADPCPPRPANVTQSIPG